MSEVLFGAPMHVLACRKRGLKLVRGRAVGTGPQNRCRIASLNCHRQSLEEVHERALLTGGLPGNLVLDWKLWMVSEFSLEI